MKKGAFRKGGRLCHFCGGLNALDRHLNELGEKSPCGVFKKDRQSPSIGMLCLNQNVGLNPPYDYSDTMQDGAGGAWVDMGPGRAFRRECQHD